MAFQVVRLDHGHQGNARVRSRQDLQQRVRGGRILGPVDHDRFGFEVGEPGQCVGRERLDLEIQAQDESAGEHTLGSAIGEEGQPGHTRISRRA